MDSVKRTDLVVRALAEGPKTSVQLAEELDMKPGVVRGLLAELTHAGEVRSGGKEGRQLLYERVAAVSG